VGTPSHCVLRRHLDILFASAGREYQEGMLADTEGSVRSMVASGLGAGIVRLDQALQAERHGELVVWPGWRAHTWLCWASPPPAKVSPAVTAVRSAVQEAWSR
jgi:DNA-binding transcriptional LysR family regulator